MLNKDHSALYDLLIECCQNTPDLSKLEILSEKITDWYPFLDSAYKHGVFPLVYKALKPVTALSDWVKADLKRVNFDISCKNMSMTSELLKVLALLESENIPVLAIKGPVLSQMIYGDVTQRQYSDLDVLVDQSEIYRVVELLSSLGYRSEHSISFLKNKTLLNIGKDFAVSNPSQTIHIEFHWRLFLDRQVRNSKIQLFSASNPTFLINNQPVMTLEEDAQLLYLLLHGSKHYWERLEWIVDIDRLIRLRGEIDWRGLSMMAQQMEIEGMFYLGLAMSYELFATPMNTAILEYIHSEHYIHTAKKEILAELKRDGINKTHSDLISLENLHKISLIKNKQNGWIRQYFLTLFQIKELDVYMVNLPNFLAPLYHFVRLYRLFKLNVLRMK